MDTPLERLRDLREILAQHDSSLHDSLKKTRELGFNGQRPLAGLFKQVRVEIPEAPLFEVNGQIAVVRQQVVHILGMVTSKIRSLERAQKEYDRRNERRSQIHHTRHVVHSCVEDGEGLLNAEETGTFNRPSYVQSWCLRTKQTLLNAFVSPWNATEFERITTAAVANTNARDPSEFMLEDGLRFLHSLDEQLYLEEGTHLAAATSVSAGSKVFIGHGRSADWKDLRDFVRDKLHLETDDFNAAPTAGYFTPERIREILDRAAFALLVMTAEDEQADGTLRARENVVHEVGLFQGRLGFRKAIIVMENGCSEFSNIHGLTHLPYPKGYINAAFEGIRDTLTREGLISNSMSK